MGEVVGSGWSSVERREAAQEGTKETKVGLTGLLILAFGMVGAAIPELRGARDDVGKGRPGERAFVVRIGGDR